MTMGSPTWRLLFKHDGAKSVRAKRMQDSGQKKPAAEAKSPVADLEAQARDGEQNNSAHNQ